MKQHTSLNEVLAYIRARNGRCLSSKPDRRGEVLQVRIKCANGHQWLANPVKLLGGGWCPKCAPAKRRLTLADMQSIAQKHDGRCLSDVYVNSVTKLLWECKLGHQWQTEAHSIRKGTWCPKCKHEAQKNTLEDMQKLAAKHNGRCLAKKYINNATAIPWHCERGHKWMAQPANVTTGKWCPRCARETKQLLALKEMHALARKRGGRCLSKSYRTNGVKLQWQCKKGHRWWAQPNNVKARSWCPVCAGNNPYSLGDLKAAAKKNGGHCLAKSFKNGRSLVRWRCEKGHIFEKDPAHVIGRDQWCKLCSGLAPHTLEEMQQLARQHGGQCLSRHYANNRTALQWKCVKGHVFAKTPKLVLNRGQWCPRCAKMGKSARNAAI